MKKLTILALMQNTFCFRRQFLAYPFRIGLGIAEGDVHDRMVVETADR
jgi:hypothetical protein